MNYALYERLGTFQRKMTDKVPTPLNFVRGDATGIDISAHAGVLRAAGSDFLTFAFRSFGSLGPELLAIEEIKHLRAHYFQCTDCRGWNGLREVFAPDAEFDHRNTFSVPHNLPRAVGKRLRLEELDRLDRRHHHQR